MHQHTRRALSHRGTVQRGTEVVSGIEEKSYDRINFNCGAPINVVLMRHHKIVVAAVVRSPKTMRMDLCEPFNLHFRIPSWRASMAMTMNAALQNCTPVT